MRLRKQSPSGDFVLGHGQNDFYIDQPEAVGQLITTRLKMTLGEYFLDQTDGTPYMTEVLGNNTIKTRDLAIQDRILATQGVSTNGIVAYSPSLNPQTRALTQTATVDTIYSSDDGSTTVTVST